MPTVNLESPEGKKFTVEAPEGATDEQIIAHVKSLGHEEPEANEAGESVFVDMMKAVPRGLAKGAAGVAGGLGTMRELAGSAAEFAGLSPETGKAALAAIPGLGGVSRMAPTPEQIQKTAEKVTGPWGESKTTPGKYTESVASFVPASLLGPGGWGARLMQIIGGGLGSEAAGEIMEAVGGESYANAARFGGGFIGGFMPRVAARTVTPLPASARHRGHVATLEQEGVTGLTAGQRSGYRPLQYMEEHLGGSPMAGRAANERFERASEQYTRAALRRIGEDADRATPQVVDRAHTRIGNNFDQLAARNNATYDAQYANAMLQAQAEYEHLFMDPLRKPIVENVIDHAFNKVANSGTMEGREYKALRSRIERMRRSNKTDPEVNLFLAHVRDAMDTLMERNIARNNPADLGAWRETRNQYRNLLVIDGAVTGVETEGIVTPAKLKQGVVAQNRSQYARGRGDFADLARSGESVMKRLPQSGTAPRSLTSSGMLKLATTGMSGRALMSESTQNWLGNQALADIIDRLPGGRVSAIRSLIANAAMQEQQEPEQPGQQGADDQQ